MRVRNAGIIPGWILMAADASIAAATVMPGPCFLSGGYGIRWSQKLQILKKSGGKSRNFQREWSSGWAE